MSSVVQSVPPLFVKDSDIGVSTITPYEMCTVAIRATSTTSLEGVQKINGLWRIYFNNRTTRLQLYSKQSILINDPILRCPSASIVLTSTLRVKS